MSLSFSFTSSGLLVSAVSHFPFFLILVEFQFPIFILFPSTETLEFRFLMAEDSPCSTQLIDGNGDFNVEGLDKFVRATKLADCGLSYAVVAIMGPQSSGKSTLLNHLFHTNFREMDAFTGRSQTTKGIWIAKCVGIEPFTIAMDLEGTDGRERGEDDTAFEKQSALFALAIADIVLINMWCHDIGREHAANKPLLKTVFQVMMRLFSPRKTTLLFVIRDKTKTPLEYLEPILREDIQKIWNIVPKPEAHRSTPLSEFFNVEVTALSSYEEKEEQFKKQVAELRQRFFHSTSPGGLAGDRQGVVPSSGFSFSAQQIWKVIKENKDLDLPAHKVMVATVRCEEIANEMLSRLSADQGWLALEEAIQVGPVPEFGTKLSSILDSYLSEYDMETIYFEEGVRTAKRQHLGSKALDLVHPAYSAMLVHVRSKVFDSFKTRLEQLLNKGEGFAASVRTCYQSCMLEFDRGCTDAAIRQANWDTSKVREKLRRDIDAHASSVRSAKLSEIIANYEKKLTVALIEPVESLFDIGSEDTWPSIRRLLKRETEAAILELSNAVAGFELDQATIDVMVQNLQSYARNVVEKKAREEAGKVLILMKERFSTVFNHDDDSMPRVWTGKEDVRTILKDAHSASLRLLSVMTAIRLDEKPDKIEHLLFSSLMDGTVAVSSSRDRSIGASVDLLASSTWEEVSPKDILITPVQCKSLWRQFRSETEYMVTQAISAQVMFSSYRCNEIIERKLDSLSDAKVLSTLYYLFDQNLISVHRFDYTVYITNDLERTLNPLVPMITKLIYLQLQSEIREAIQAGPKNFAERLVPILKTCLSEYDEETKDLDKGIRTARREYLKSKVLELFHPMYGDMLNRLCEKAINTFKTSLEQSLNEGKNFAESVDTLSESCVLEFDRECAAAGIAEAKWGDASTIRKTLQRFIQIYASLIDKKIKAENNRAETSQVFGEMSKLASSVASIVLPFLINRNCSLD